MPQYSRTLNLVVGLVLLAAAGSAGAASCGGDFCINWYSIDSGGVMVSESADQQWKVAGTIGQWDASEARELIGGSWRLSGGFWGMNAQVSVEIILSDLNQIYTGDPLDATVATDPAGLSYEVTYDGSTDVPTDAGIYAVEASIIEPYHQGAASGTLTIDPAAATLTLEGLEQTWNGDPRPVTVTPDPADVSYSVSYDGASQPPSAVGEYSVVATITDDNHTGDDAGGTLVISEAESETSIGSISPPDSQTVGQSYTVTVTVAGSGLTGTVDVEDGTGGSCQVTLPGDSCQMTSATAGSKTIVATYSGDDSHTGSSDTTNYEISQAESQIEIVSIDPADEQIVNEPYTVTVNVDGFDATGTVDVDDGMGASCQVILPDGSCPLTSTTVGTRTITASYGGDDNNAGSSAQSSYEIVSEGPAALALSAAPTRAVAGELITPGLSVQVVDSQGELVEDDDETVVMVSFEANPTGATLSGVTELTVTGGEVHFEDLSIDLVGQGYRLNVSDSDEALEAVVTQPFDVLDPTILRDRFEQSAQRNHDFPGQEPPRTTTQKPGHPRFSRLNAP